jgi:hypothetical protein
MQRQLRLGDILDDYCPRERRVTNHAVVAMVDTEVKQTRCTTCDAEHEYKQAKIPRQRRKADAPSTLYSQVAAGAPRRVAQEAEETVPAHTDPEPADDQPVAAGSAERDVEREPGADAGGEDETEDDRGDDREDAGPAHRRLIRASLPRPEGQPPPTRPIPEFTIRQPGGRPNRFRARHQRGGQPPFHGNRSNGNMGGPFRGNAGPRPPRRHGGQGGGRKRSK